MGPKCRKYNMRKIWGKHVLRVRHCEVYAVMILKGSGKVFLVRFRDYFKL